MGSFAVNRQWLSGQGLHNEIRNYTAVIRAHSWPIRVEDSHDPRVDAVIAAVGHGHGLGKPFCLVINASRTDGVYVAPVSFQLGVHLGIAIDFRGACQKKPSALLFGEPQGFVGAQ